MFLEFTNVFCFLFTALRIHLSLQSRNALEMYPGYHLVCRGEIPVKGKGNMRTYFLCGKDGFTKELPICDETELRASVTSLNSMASLVSSQSMSSPASTPKTSQVSDVSVSEELDSKYKSKRTSILEVTCL